MQSVLSKNDSGNPSDNLRSEGMFSTASGNRERLHPLVQPFYSNLDILDYLASQKLHSLVQRGEKSRIMQRDAKARRNQRLTPDLNSSPKIPKVAKRRQTKMDPTVSQSNDEKISLMMSDDMPR